MKLFPRFLTVLTHQNIKNYDRCKKRYIGRPTDDEIYQDLNLFSPEATHNPFVADSIQARFINP
jgi:hypothetical protein